MSVSSVDVILGRIRSAPAESPIAVFTNRSGYLLNAVFANTVATQGLIHGHCPRLVGVFDHRSPIDAVARQLNAVSGNAEALSVAKAS
ncbi:hypothetical protein HCU74_08310 [Spongiibacter sp. KMU-166]|uniref:Uncharacterized protein n=1 Tax=Spongiibacter thalassae TaxID=2721624 RepID=A0ABX1GG57_9GAMM|nr:hypothetical protein [Spongiibacter thalassae]NKI17418.1 hypothetical protein [Spongiibacter thalassae]